MGAYLRCPTCGEEDSFEVSVGCDNKECLSNTVWETNKQLQAENEFLKKRVSELEKDCDKFVNIGFVCEGEARDFKAENEALKAKVAVLVETVRKMNRFFNCPTSCGIDSVDDKREAAFEQASELCDSALKDLSQTDQAYTEQVKKEAYQEASDYFKNHFDTVVMPELKTNEQKNLERVQSAVDTKITDVSEQVRREAVQAERCRSEALWTLLDDIDTAGDVFKPIIDGYFKYVNQKTKERHQYLQSDGYSLFEPGSYQNKDGAGVMRFNTSGNPQQETTEASG